MIEIYDIPSDVSADDGAVMLDGPGGLAITITAAAALATADRLIDAASEAQGQWLMAEAARVEIERIRNSAKSGE